MKYHRGAPPKVGSAKIHHRSSQGDPAQTSKGVPLRFPDVLQPDSIDPETPIDVARSLLIRSVH